jgi:hypothetical protein
MVVENFKKLIFFLKTQFSTYFNLKTPYYHIYNTHEPIQSKLEIAKK